VIGVENEIMNKLIAMSALSTVLACAPAVAGDAAAGEKKEFSLWCPVSDV